MSVRTLTPKQLAAELQVSTQTLRRWVKQGVCPKPLWLAPGTVRFREDDIAKWLATEAWAAGRLDSESAAAGISADDNDT